MKIETIERPEPCGTTRETMSFNSYVSWIESTTRRGAEKRNLPFNLSKRWIGDKVKHGRCEVTGIIFQKAGPWCPSIDRINNDLGYLPENCRMVVWALNRAKFRWNDAILLKLCEEVVRHKEKLFLEK